MYGSFLSFLSFLIDPVFWSRIGFLISYIATFLIALEVIRLVYTDANKRDIEKFLEQYSKQRTQSPLRRRKSDDVKKINVSIEELERSVSPAREERPIESERMDARPVRAAITPESDKTELRRRRAQSSASQSHLKQERTASPTPLRKLRKRSDTLTSTGSSESRRRHREASPASEAAGSRHASPRPRSREDREKRVGLGLGRLVRGKV